MSGAITFQFPEADVKISDGKISVEPVEYYESKDMVSERGDDREVLTCVPGHGVHAHGWRGGGEVCD